MLVAHVAFLVLFVGTTAFFTILSILNLRHGQRALERERGWVEDRLGLTEPDRILAYQRAKSRFGQSRTWAFVGLVLLALYSGALARVVEGLEGLGYGSVLTGVVFFVGVAVALRLFSLPFEAYEAFVIEERFEFNNLTPGLFVRDAVVGTTVTVAFTVVLAGGVLWAIAFVPDWWWLAVLALFVAFSLAMLVIYPRVIAPLFNDFEPVEGGELREAVERVFDRAGFSCEGIYVMDASRRSSHANAYFVGFGRAKRVVLFDTLVERMTLPEIEAVLAHELAHWKRAHVWKSLGASTVRIGALLFVLWYLLGTRWLYEMFTLPETAYAGLAVGALWIQPLSKLSRPLENRLSLAHEREADAVATDVMGEGDPLVDALCRLTGENLSNPFPHPLYAAFHYTHPPVPERIRYIRELDGTDSSDAPSPATVGSG
ncbi:M48 family metallopeptidase [Natrialbaceae archaeon AArc-T1-2]|uniref:M48 family metallopeptidase n=1 Tax=Natrialbaceae archaeon AArc-T1-2 TaxID=3053904 RepID=UPI00255AB57C|nr:M48 family metallopeptidase [Natrialbaceae archaeon AArc-T1-2]WIV67913.1 M48 family metallopeptidase [Natrialbaceae archaeon AArc-T1-2]